MRRKGLGILVMAVAAHVFSAAAFSQVPVIVHQIPRVVSGWGGGIEYYDGKIYETWVTGQGGASDILIKDPQTGQHLDTIQGPYSQGLHDLSYDSKRNVFWGTCWGGPLVSFPVTGGDALASFIVTTHKYGVFYDEELDCLWVAAHVLGQLMRVNPDNGQVEEVITVNHGLGPKYDAPCGVARTGDTFWIGSETDYGRYAYILEINRQGQPTGRIMQMPAVDKNACASGGMTLDPEGFLWVKGGKYTAIYKVDIGWSPSGPAGAENWYLAGGATQIFDQYILIYNPNKTAAEVQIQYVGEKGPAGDPFNYIVEGGSRFTAKVNDVRDGWTSIGTIVRSLNSVGIVVERSMYGPKGGGADKWLGGHNTIGLMETGKEWWLAEGSTERFDEFVHVLNPGDSNATVNVVFHNQNGIATQTQKTMVPKSVWTVKANDVAGIQTQLSTHITSTQPVAVDRTMYWPKGAGASWADGHATIGLKSSSTEWYFAEGATHLFDQYILVINPGAANADVLFAFRDQTGREWTHRRTVAGGRRYTLNVNTVTGNQTQVSARVVSLNGVGIMAERSMYWDKGDPSKWKGGHGTVGATAPSRDWYLPEGSTLKFDEYLMVFNPSANESAAVNFSFMDAGGNITPYSLAVAPMGRGTVKVNNLVPNNTQVSSRVKSNIPVVAERTMYWPKGGPWRGGHASIGYAP